jgi:hypothetical protein
VERFVERMQITSRNKYETPVDGESAYTICRNDAPLDHSVIYLGTVTLDLHN